MVDDKKTDKTIKTNDSNDSWLDQHDLNELIETSNLDILPKYEIIKENDLITSRKVIIDSLPKHVSTVKNNTNLELEYVNIMDSEIRYSLPFNSKALQRSFIILAIKESNAKKPNEIDFSKLIGKMYGLKREQFTTKGFTQSPLKFFRLEK